VRTLQPGLQGRCACFTRAQYFQACTFEGLESITINSVTRQQMMFNSRAKTSVRSACPFLADNLPTSSGFQFTQAHTPSQVHSSPWTGILIDLSCEGFTTFSFTLLVHRPIHSSSPVQIHTSPAQRLTDFFPQVHSFTCLGPPATCTECAWPPRPHPLHRSQ